MNKNLKHITNRVYKPCSFSISDLVREKESGAYGAYRYTLNGRSIVSRDAKVTPTKIGQFVTFWKRSKGGSIEPFNENDGIDFFCVNVLTEQFFGQFVFPKSVLLEKGILSRRNKDGKRAFRVYPPWDVPQNKTAEKTQQWQLNYFYQLNHEINLDMVAALYNLK